MGNRVVGMWRVVVVLGALTLGLAGVASASAAPAGHGQRLTGRILLVDAYQERPLALVKTGWQDVVVRFPHRGHLKAFDVDDVLRLQVVPSRDWVYDVVRVELVVRVDKYHPDDRFLRVGKVQRLDRFDDLDGAVRVVVVRADDYDHHRRVQHAGHPRVIEIDDVERVVIVGGVVYIDRFDEDDRDDNGNDNRHDDNRNDNGDNDNYY